MKKLLTVPLKRGMLFSITVGLVMLSSCGGDDAATPAPVASFEYEADGLEVTFTNKSTNATTYLWDFGDGETSTEQSPAHAYEAFGIYNVKLTATGSGGTATSPPDELTLAKSSDVVIDGTFTDWNDIAPAASSTDGAAGSLSVLKVDYDALKVYIYVKGDLTFLTRVYLNSDNVVATGATTPAFDYLWRDMGADYFMETNFIDGAQLFKDDPAVEDWGWTEQIAWPGASFLTYSALKTSGTQKEGEFSFLRASIPGISTTAIRFGVIDISADYANAGALPLLTRGDGESQVFGETFLLDLTK